MIPLLFFLLLLFLSLQIEPDKVLVIFFSRAGFNYNVGNVTKGNTEVMVDYIKKVTNFDSHKIIPLIDYPIDYQETLNRTNREKSTQALPDILNNLTDISDYDAILLGYPIWHADLPRIVVTQLKLLDFEGKTIYPFNTHEGSGVGNSIEQIKKYASKAIVKEGFSLKGTEARKDDSHESIRKWLSDILGRKVEDSNYIKRSMFLLLFIFLVF